MIKRFLLVLFLGLALLAGLYLLFVFRFTYSSGERAGWVQKFSEKGWICKTWEGEIAMAAIPGSVPEKFSFTVRDGALARRVNASVGERVRLHYEQHRLLPGTCFGETEYWVDDITVVGDQGVVPSPTPAGPPVPAAAPPAAPGAPQGAAPGVSSAAQSAAPSAAPTTPGAAPGAPSRP